MKHHVVDARGTRIHCVEAGSGPLVLLVHGFPESWYSWRHQIPAIADAGFRAVAIDVRGYGRSSAPLEVEAYGMVHHVGDNVGVVEALTGPGSQAIIIGHDWGSPIAAHSALLRPDLFTAVAMLSVPYNAPGGPRPTEAFARFGEATSQLTGLEEEFYINYFQQPGRAEREFELDVRAGLLKFYVGASADARRSTDGGTTATLAKGTLLLDRVTLPDALPSWLTEADLDFYAEEFERTGFRGPLNRYRNVDRDWLDLRAWTGAPIRQPSLFIAGDRDGPAMWGKGAIGRFPESLPGLRGSHILEKCGHWVQQEKPEEVTRLLVDWLESLEQR
ncbi:MAG TPA: alpha/beta hydrolase [Mycobacteriales bacterium]|jgi:pimeloyl-ACP methyl ester carboxylesterase|nr:alpha/beta hydrolase [Mycobacteriales bacterium]